MIEKLLRVVKSRRYARGMTSPRKVPRVEPVRRDPGLDHWVGMWVAVKDGRVIAAAYNSRDLVPKVIEMGPAGKGAVAQFVPQPTDDIVIGVG